MPTEHAVKNENLNIVLSNEFTPNSESPHAFTCMYITWEKI